MRCRTLSRLEGEPSRSSACASLFLRPHRRLFSNRSRADMAANLCLVCHAARERRSGIWLRAGEVGRLVQLRPGVRSSRATWGKLWVPMPLEYVVSGGGRQGDNIRRTVDERLQSVNDSVKKTLREDQYSRIAPSVACAYHFRRPGLGKKRLSTRACCLWGRQRRLVQLAPRGDGSSRSKCRTAGCCQLRRLLLLAAARDGCNALALANPLQRRRLRSGRTKLSHLNLCALAALALRARTGRALRCRRKGERAASWRQWC